MYCKVWRVEVLTGIVCSRLQLEQGKQTVRVVTGILLLLVLPVLLCLLIFAATDIGFNTCYFDPAFGGDPLLFQHLFWVFGHPEVYIIILPAFGLISDVLASSCHILNVFSTTSLVLATACIGLVGAYVWGHHRFAAGRGTDAKAYFTTATVLVALPTATKVFAWAVTYST